MVLGEVEIIHCTRHVEVGVGVEPLHESATLVAQVALDLKVGVEREGRRFAILQLAAELGVQRLIGQIGDVGRHAGHRKPFLGPGPGLEVAALAPIGVGHDGLPPDLVEGDVL